MDTLRGDDVVARIPARNPANLGAFPCGTPARNLRVPAAAADRLSSGRWVVPCRRAPDRSMPICSPSGAPACRIGGPPADARAAPAASIRHLVWQCAARHDHTGRRIKTRALDREEYAWESLGRSPVDPADHVKSRSMAPGSGPRRVRMDDTCMWSRDGLSETESWAVILPDSRSDGRDRCHDEVRARR
jgi:hypothetical protein